MNKRAKSKSLILLLLVLFPLVSAYCSDTDGGKVYGVSGYIKTGRYWGGDYCLDNNILREFYCENESKKQIDVDCRDGDAKCVISKCVRSEKLPDLIIESIDHPQSTDKDTAFHLNITIKNTGTEQTDDYVLRISSLGQKIGDFNKYGLGPGSSIEIRTSLEIPNSAEEESYHEFDILLDYRDEVPEKNETNNNISFEIYVEKGNAFGGNTTICQETDQGKEYELWGQVWGEKDNQNFNYSDRCNQGDQNLLEEWYCDADDEPANIYVNCGGLFGEGYFCQEGVCIFENSSNNTNTTQPDNGSNNTLAEISCYSDADCSDSLTENFCDGTDLYEQKTVYSCQNSGQEDSFCNKEITERLLESCVVCKDAGCKDSVQEELPVPTAGATLEPDEPSKEPKKEQTPFKENFVKKTVKKKRSISQLLLIEQEKDFYERSQL